MKNEDLQELLQIRADLFGITNILYERESAMKQAKKNINLNRESRLMAEAAFLQAETAYESALDARYAVQMRLMQLVRQKKLTFLQAQEIVLQTANRLAHE